MNATPAPRDLENLVAPIGQTIHIGGEELHVAPAMVGVLARMLVAARPLIDALRGAEGGMTPLQMLALHPQAVLEVAAIAIDKPMAWIEKLAPDEAVSLIGAVAQENRDFFVRRVLPQMTATMAKWNTAMPIPGATPSTH